MSALRDALLVSSVLTLKEPYHTLVPLTDTHKELKRVSQVLVNNGFSNRDIERQIHRSLDKWYSVGEQQQRQEGTAYKLYFRNNMSSQYKEDERRLKKVFQEDVTLTNEEDKIKLTIYYKNNDNKKKKKIMGT